MKFIQTWNVWFVICQLTIKLVFSVARSWCSFAAAERFGWRGASCCTHRHTEQTSDLHTGLRKAYKDTANTENCWNPTLIRFTACAQGQPHPSTFNTKLRFIKGAHFVPLTSACNMHGMTLLQFQLSRVDSSVPLLSFYSCMPYCFVRTKDCMFC